MTMGVYVGVCVCECVRACVSACMRAWVRVCICVYEWRVLLRVIDVSVCLCGCTVYGDTLTLPPAGTNTLVNANN